MTIITLDHVDVWTLILVHSAVDSASFHWSDTTLDSVITIISSAINIQGSELNNDRHCSNVHNIWAGKWRVESPQCPAVPYASTIIFCFVV